MNTTLFETLSFPGVGRSMHRSSTRRRIVTPRTSLAALTRSARADRRSEDARLSASAACAYAHAPRPPDQRDLQREAGECEREVERGTRPVVDGHLYVRGEHQREEGSRQVSRTCGASPDRATPAASPSSATPLSAVQNRRDPGSTCGTMESKVSGATKSATPAQARSPANPKAHGSRARGAATGASVVMSIARVSTRSCCQVYRAGRARCSVRAVVATAMTSGTTMTAMATRVLATVARIPPSAAPNG